jgi:hypothetical protein
MRTDTRLKPQWLRRARHSRRWDQSCKTNPIRAAGADRVKRTQFGPGWARPDDGQTKDAKRTQLARANYAKRTQFGPAWAGRRRAKDAKRSQLPGSPAKGKDLAGKELWLIGQTEGPGETKPIPAGAGRDGGVGATAQNEPNCGRRRRRTCGIGILPMIHGLEGDREPSREVMRLGPDPNAELCVGDPKPMLRR